MSNNNKFLITLLCPHEKTDTPDNSEESRLMDELDEQEQILSLSQRYSKQLEYF